MLTPELLGPLVRTRTFPIHPIDAVIIPEQGEEPRADADASICISAFSYNVGNYVGVPPRRFPPHAGDSRGFGGVRQM